MAELFILGGLDRERRNSFDLPAVISRGTVFATTLFGLSYPCIRKGIVLCSGCHFKPTGVRFGQALLTHSHCLGVIIMSASERFCPVCKHKNEAEAIVCWNCGTT